MKREHLTRNTVMLKVRSFETPLGKRSCLRTNSSKHLTRKTVMLKARSFEAPD